MSGTVRLALLASVVLGMADGARADDGALAPLAGSWFTQNGPIGIHFRDKSEVRVNGTRVSGLEANAADDFTLSNSIGYHVTPNISAQLVLGIPTETEVNNQDGARLGKISYGAPSFVLDYRLNQFGAIQPFAGIGAMYLFFYDEEDAALSNLKVDDTVGLILRAGAEMMLDRNFGIYVAANKVFIEADARADLGANRVNAQLDLDPWIPQAGITFRF